MQAWKQTVLIWDIYDEHEYRDLRVTVIYPIKTSKTLCAPLSESYNEPNWMLSEDEAV